MERAKMENKTHFGIWDLGDFWREKQIWDLAVLVSISIDHSFQRN